MHTVLASYGYCCVGMQWAAGGRILLNPNVGLKSVGARRGGSQRLVFPSCAGQPAPGHACQTGGFILSPNREYAAARVSTDFSDPHPPWGIGLVRLRPGQDPAVLPTPLATQEDGGITDRVLAFSPDSTQVVFARFSWDGWTATPEGLFALPLGGGGPVPLAQTAIPGATLLPDEVQQLQWSPDGRWIAFVKGEELNVVSTTGASAPLVLRCGDGADSWDFAWSPASDRLAYDCAEYFQQKWTYRFMIVAPDGTNGVDLLQSHRLAYAYQPSWSPDGSRLLFVAPRIGRRPTHVWTIHPDGRGLTLIG